MSELQIFNSEEFGEIRTVEIKGKTYFIAKDIANALGYSNPRDAISRHCKGVVKHDSFKDGGNEIALIPEGDIYRLVIKSQLPSADKFESWIFDEVIPSIRQNGGYVNNDELFIKTYLPFADETTKTLFRTTLEVVKNQNQKIQELTPKAEYFDCLVERKLLTNFRDTAKELHIPPKTFMNFLIDKKFVYRDQSGKVKPYQSYMQNGLFEIKEFVNQANGFASTQTLVTPKGRETFNLLIHKEGV